MPTVLRIGSWRFHFYSDEGSEPPHIHVDTGEGEIKFWLQPVRLARARGVGGTEIRDIEREVAYREAFLVEAWYGFFKR